MWENEFSVLEVGRGRHLDEKRVKEDKWED